MTAALICIRQPTESATPATVHAAAAAPPDTVKVLIVFVKFADDQTAGGPEVGFRAWPLYTDPTELPQSAPYLLSPSPHAPFTDSTLSAYFYTQSNGNLVMFGDVYPHTVVTSGPEALYHAPLGGYGDLTLDVVQQMDRGGVDFSRYDFNGDGVMDQLFLILRSDSEKDAGRISWTGASCLDARCANGPPAGRRRDPVTVDGTLIDWNRSGSVIFNRTPGNVDAHYWLVRMMAHEYGHDLWRRHFVHIPAIPDNDVPERSNYRRPTNTLGYVLMAGAGGGNDARGDETISAFERDLLGWIDCRELNATATAVAIRDLYTSGDCIRVPTGDRRRTRMLYVTNRQRIGPFDRYRRAGSRHQFEIGLLRTTGLLVGIASGNRYEVLPADNSLELSADNATYQGDLFGSGRQITPWTRPNINGYNRYPGRFEPSWHAIDNIRSDPDDPRILVFDYSADFRENPIIREDSFLGDESSGQRLTGTVRVARGTLSVNTEISLDGRLTVAPGASLEVSTEGTLIVEDNSMLVLEAGSQLTVEGELRVSGILLPYARSAVRRGPSGRITVVGVR